MLAALYDAENRLVKVEDDLTKEVWAEYGYDPFGRRLWKEVGGTRTYFFYSDEGLIAEYDATGNELRSYGYESDSTWGTNPLWLKQNGQYYWYQNDHLGTPQKLIDSSGIVVWEARYAAFGKAEIQVETVENNLRFPGQYYDAETGLHYNWHRYYEPGSGRYTQTDPLGFDGGDVNWYAYVGNNPVNWVDPYGLVTGVEVAVGCLATSPCREIVIGGTIVVSLAIGQAARSVYESLPPVYIPPFPTIGVAPSDNNPYIYKQPPGSLLIPRLPSIQEYCDPTPPIYESQRANQRELEKLKRQAAKSTYQGRLVQGETPPPPPSGVCEKLWQIMHNSKSVVEIVVTYAHYLLLGCGSLTPP